jgi:hypothetical protein
VAAFYNNPECSEAGAFLWELVGQGAPVCRGPKSSQPAVSWVREEMLEQLKNNARSITEYLHMYFLILS